MHNQYQHTHTHSR